MVFENLASFVIVIIEIPTTAQLSVALCYCIKKYTQALIRILL